jgi:predicted ABC-type transport system involved in lysophospholipase L1 biosynthesis ATPase subunit
VVGLLLDAATMLGAALVLSTHDLTIAERFPDRWQMADGLMIAEDAEGGDPC